MAKAAAKKKAEQKRKYEQKKKQEAAVAAKKKKAQQNKKAPAPKPPVVEETVPSDEVLAELTSGLQELLQESYEIEEFTSFFKTLVTDKGLAEGDAKALTIAIVKSEGLGQENLTALLEALPGGDSSCDKATLAAFVITELQAETVDVAALLEKVKAKVGELTAA